MSRPRNLPPRWVWAPRPARSLSLEEARAQMRAYADAGAVDIISGAESGRMTVGATIEGVQHSYLDGNKIEPRHTIDNLDPRFGVLLVRLDAMLAGLGIDELLDIGITHGSSNEMDVHNQGRAIDIGGLRGSGVPGGDVRVFRDWGQRPEQGRGIYRLSSGDPGYDLWPAIYAVGSEEGADRNTSMSLEGGGLPTRIGEGSYILSPDHPDPKLHADHQNHIHMQIGRTQGVEP